MRNKKYSQGLDVAETPTKLVYIHWGTYSFSRVDFGYVTVYGCCIIRVLLEYGLSDFYKCDTWAKHTIYFLLWKQIRCTPIRQECISCWGPRLQIMPIFFMEWTAAATCFDQWWRRLSIYRCFEMWGNLEIMRICLAIGMGLRKWCRDGHLELPLPRGFLQLSFSEYVPSKAIHGC